MNRVSTVVLAIACVVTGFALAGTRVKALEDVSPARFPSDITVGTRVVMTWENGQSVDCTIERMDVGWVKCAPDETPFTRTERPGWFAIARFTAVGKVQPKR